jgi:topoisomerase-4 subunit A
VNREEFANILFAKTSLEFGCKFNLISIGIDGKPRQKGLLDVLREWSEFRIRTVKRRCAYRLQAIEDRIEVLEGRLLVLLSIDEVIRIIRESDDPKTELQTRFNLSERQVEDILEIKLRQLAKLEDLKLRKELEEKEKERNRLRTLLDNDKKLRALVVDELRSDAKKYGDERRTLIKEAEGAVVAKKIVDEPTTVVISQKGFIRARAAHNIDAKSLSFKLGDGYLADFECRSVDYLVLLSNLGRAYSIPVSDLPNARGDGTHISAFVQFTEGERPAAWFAGAGSTPLLIASNNAMGFLCKAENLVVRQKAGKTFFDMDKGAAVLAMTPLKENLKLLAGLSESGRLVVFAIDEIGERSSGGKGVLLMDLAKGEKLIAALPCTENGIIVCGVGRGNKAQELSIGPRLIEEYRCRRARKGKNVQAKWKFTGLLPGKADQKTSDGVLIE